MRKSKVDIAMDEWLKGNHVKAEKLLIKEAEAGSGHAAHNLGTLYCTGGDGVPVDKAKSMKYYEQALASGFEETIATDPEWFRNNNLTNP